MTTVFAPSYFKKEKDTWLAVINEYNFGTLVVPSINPEYFILSLLPLLSSSFFLFLPFSFFLRNLK